MKAFTEGGAVSMEVLSVFFVASLLWSAACSRVLDENGIWEQDFGLTGSDGGGSELEFYDASAGPEKLSIEIVQKEGGAKELEDSEVDEETIRKAERVADKDLLNGLNRILKNNETLRDIFKAENVYPLT